MSGGRGRKRKRKEKEKCERPNQKQKLGKRPNRYVTRRISSGTAICSVVVYRHVCTALYLHARRAANRQELPENIGGRKTSAGCNLQRARHPPSLSYRRSLRRRGAPSPLTRDEGGL